MNKKIFISIVAATIVTAIILLSPISITNLKVFACLCGGCCIGCPADCNTIGTPIAYSYWGINKISGEVVNQISTFGIITDIFIWIILMFLIYKFIYKK